MSEIELLRQFRASRSESAFAALVRGHTNLVYSVAKRRAGDSHLAEDITQLVFIRLARTPPNVQSEPEFLGWLHRTTVNVAIDAWRAESRRKVREEKAAPMPVETTSSNWKDIAPDLDEALDRLSDGDRHVILLRFLNCKSMREVGADLCISEDAAKMRVSRALERLRSQLGVTSTSCTAAVLGALLLENPVEAAPSHLLEKLLKIHVGAAGSTIATGSVIWRVIGTPAGKIAAGLALTGCAVCLMFLWPSAWKHPRILCRSSWGPANCCEVWCVMLQVTH